MKMPAAILEGYSQVISSENDTVGLCLIKTIMQNSKYTKLKETPLIDKSSLVLIFSI